MLLALLCLLLAGGLACWLVFAPPASPINRANALKIKPGMMLTEVEELLGGPERDDSGLDGDGWGLLDPKADFAFITAGGGSFVTDHRRRVRIGDFRPHWPRQNVGIWRRRGGQIIVQFGTDRKVLAVQWDTIRDARAAGWLPRTVRRWAEWWGME